MQVDHLTIFIEQGYSWIVDLLYDVSEKNSLLRQYVETQEFKDFYVSRVIDRSSFKELSRLATLQKYGEISHNHLVELAEECKWDILTKVFVSYIGNNHYEQGKVLQTLIVTVKSGRLEFVKFFCKQYRWKSICSDLYAKLLYLVSSVDIELLDEMIPCSLPYGNLKKYLDKIEFPDQLFAFCMICTEIPGNIVLNYASKLLDLTTVEGRKEYKQGVATICPLHNVINLTTFYNYLTFATTLADYIERVNYLYNEKWIELEDFDKGCFDYLENFRKKL